MAYEELKRMAEEAMLPMPLKRRRPWYNRQRAFSDAANPSAILALIAQNETLERERDALAEALTPSGDTKAAYHGEFKFQVTQWRENDDEEWEEYLADVTVPWTTVKEIMAAITQRASSRSPQ